MNRVWALFTITFLAYGSKHHELNNIYIINVISFTEFSGIARTNKTNKQKQYSSTLASSGMFWSVFYNE